MQSEQIEKILSLHLSRSLPNHAIKDVYFYASLPGGKLFRPHLVWSILRDLNPITYAESINNCNSNHALLSSAVEMHHTYTLLHDDLPAMDNDLTRRGKPCTHIAFGEWQALLAGDGLLNISYQLVSKIDHYRSQQLLRFMSWALGPKGLIQGQVMDLNHEMTKCFSNTLRTHELKTARLIQTAILGSSLIALPTRDYQKEKKLWKYSRLLGVNFQFIDDLSELAEEKLSDHEKAVNPWIHFPDEVYAETIRGLNEFKRLSTELKLKNTDKIVADYYQKMLLIIVPNITFIENHTKGALDFVPMILLMKTFGNI